MNEGKVRTYDMMRIPGGAKAISQGAATTVQMTDAILAKLDKQRSDHGVQRGHARTEQDSPGRSKVSESI